jgi:hypothetical protein
VGAGCDGLRQLGEENLDGVLNGDTLGSTLHSNQRLGCCYGSIPVSGLFKSSGDGLRIVPFPTPSALPAEFLLQRSRGKYRALTTLLSAPALFEFR